MRVRWFFACFLSLPLLCQTKHPFTFEDMIKLKRVEEPVVSPDGKWVLFAAVDVDLTANTKTPHVWVVPLSSSPEKAAVAHTSPGLASVGSVAKETAGSSTPQDHSPANDPAAVGTTGKEEKEIISDQDADRPRWAPDGKRFAFVSTKENGSQIWIADFDVATGTVTGKHRLTNIATEADGELWSPDGKYILFKSDVYPECNGAPDELACNAKKVEDAKNSKVKALIFTHLLYRHWNAYKEGKRTHLLVVPPLLVFVSSRVAVSVGDATDSVRDLTPADYDAPVFSLGGQDDYAFSPDGKEICYASNHDAMPAASTSNDLFTVPVAWPADATSAQVIAATKNITAENRAADNTPLYSPDGKYIAYRAQSRPGYESDRWRLMLHDRKTGQKKELSWGDGWAGSFAWHPDSTTITWVEENWGITLFVQAPVVMPPQPVKQRPPHTGAPIQGSPVSPNAQTNPAGGRNPCFPTFGVDDDPVYTNDGDLVFTHMQVNRPTEIWLLHKVCDEPVHLTDMNKDVLTGIDMSELERFQFPGAHKDNPQGFLVKPPNFDPNKKYPVKFLIHGGPQGAWGDDWSYRWNPELFAANGYVVIMINFHGSTGYGQRFIDAINGDWGGAPFEDLMKGLDYAEHHYPFIDKNRECALGASYGGYMTNWILGHTNRFKCIVTHDGTFNNESDWGTTEELWFNEWEFRGTPYTNRDLYRKWSPHLFATNFKTPTLVIHGQLDYRLDVSEGFQLFTTLQRLGVPSKMLYFPEEGHWVLKPQNSQLWYKTVNDWVDQWVGK